jgi:hypothetical protein
LEVPGLRGLPFQELLLLVDLSAQVTSDGPRVWCNVAEVNLALL